MTRGPEDVYDDVAVDAWIQDDPDPVTRAELTELLSAARSHGEHAQAARRALSDAFSGTLAFGTAGLRGRLGGGPNRMNRVVVIRLGPPPRRPRRPAVPKARVPLKASLSALRAAWACSP